MIFCATRRSVARSSTSSFIESIFAGTTKPRPARCAWRRPSRRTLRSMLPKTRNIRDRERPAAACACGSRPISGSPAARGCERAPTSVSITSPRTARFWAVATSFRSVATRTALEARGSISWPAPLRASRSFPRCASTCSTCEGRPRWPPSRGWRRIFGWPRASPGSRPSERPTRFRYFWYPCRA